MFENIKQLFEWGIYTAEYIKSYFVDETHTITEEEYNEIVNAKS